MGEAGRNDRLGQAVELEKKARELHSQGQFQQAQNEYLSCLKVFQFVYRWEQNPKVKEMVRERIEELVTIAEKLKEQLAAGYSPQMAGAPPAAGATAAATRPPPSQPGGAPAAPPGEEQKDENDLEKERLQKALAGQILTEKPNVRWDDVAGLQGAKDMLQETLVLPIRFPQLFTGKRKPFKGILLYGPPGTGKSYLAKACATEVDATFFSISSSDLVSKWQGESEKNVRQLFELARASKPSIVFIDEVDSLCGARGDGESEAARRIKTEFLSQMDGVGKDDGTGQMLILGATNTPWDLDTGIRRRFEKRIYIHLPEIETRSRMLELALGDTPHEVTKEDFYEIAKKTDNFSGADISILTRDAIMEPLRRCKRARTFCRVSKAGSDGVVRQYWSPCSPAAPGATEMTLYDVNPQELLEPSVLPCDFEVALAKNKSSVDASQLRQHDEWTEQFGMDG